MRVFPVRAHQTRISPQRQRGRTRRRTANHSGDRFLKKINPEIIVGSVSYADQDLEAVRFGFTRRIVALTVR